MPWIWIEFGPRNKVDQRNSFAAVLPFDPAHFNVIVLSVRLVPRVGHRGTSGRRASPPHGQNLAIS